MRKLRTLDAVEEGYFRENPNEIDDYLAVIFDEYTKDQDIGALLASLRVILQKN